MGAAKPSETEGQNIEMYLAAFKGDDEWDASKDNQGVAWEAFHAVTIKAIRELNSITSGLMARMVLSSIKEVGISSHSKVQDMTEPLSRPELDAKLEAIEAKMDGRLARIEDSVQRIVDMAAEIKNDNRDIRQSVSSLKTTIIVTVILGAIAIVFGVASFNTSLTSNMFSAFQLGQQTGSQAKK